MINKDELNKLHAFRKRINTSAWLSRTWKANVPAEGMPPFVSEYEKINKETFDEYVEYFDNLIYNYVGKDVDTHEFVIKEDTGKIMTKKEEEEEKEKEVQNKENE